MSKVQSILALNLKALIEKKEISQAELGRQTGCTAQAVGTWLMAGNKAKFPSPETIDKICNYFCISPAQLLTEQAEVKAACINEKLLLDTFRKLNADNQSNALIVLQALLTTQEKSVKAV